MPDTLNSGASRIPVVVLSAGITGLGVVRSFGRQGIPVFVYPASADEVRHSRWYRPLPGCETDPHPVVASAHALRRALEASRLGPVFLCACSDDWTRVVSELGAEGDARLLSVVPPLAALETLQNKGRLAMLLHELGVPMPPTRLIGSAAEIADLPESPGTFQFLKPTDSQRFHMHFGVKGLRVSSAAEARRRLDEVHAAGLSVVLQEYVPGPCTEHHFLDGYVARDGTTPALFARRRLRIYPPDFGNSTSMVSIPLAEVEPAAATLRRVLEAVHYRGIFSAEFKRDPRDGEFKLLEVNTRPWWFIDFAVRCGVDICRLAYEDAQGHALTPAGPYRVGISCIHPYYDYFAARSLWQSGRLGRLRWAAELVRAMQPVACWDDPVPAVADVSRVLGSALRRRLPGRQARAPRRRDLTAK